MVLRTLELRHFRNLGVQELHFPPAGVAIVGDNAQGKTNLLEAIYYLESFRSFRGASDGELAAFGEAAFHLRGGIDGGDVESVAAGFDRTRKSKRVTLDGSDALKMSAALGKLGAVVLSPVDVGLVNGGPGVRRRFLDIVLSLNAPGYVTALQDYRKWLAQRNAALRAAAGGGSRDWIRAWEGGLVESAAKVARMRSAWISDWGATYAGYYEAISGADSATIDYKPGLGARSSGDHARLDDMREDAVRERFRDRLDECFDRDLHRGATGVGPHRDEVVLSVSSQGGSLPLRTFGSGGQRRTAALALRLTEAATIRKQRHTDPILLVDDAFAELDRGRSGRVMPLLEAELKGQVILTAPKESDVTLPGRTLARWRMHGGVIEA